MSAVPERREGTWSLREFCFVNPRLRTTVKALARFLVRVCRRACLAPPVYDTPATRLHCAADNHTRVQLEGTVTFGTLT